MMIQAITFVFLALTLSILGAVLYFKRMCMVANSLSHTSLLGVILAFFFLGQSTMDLSLSPISLVIAALLSSFLTLFLMNVCQRVLKAQDASIGFIFTFLFALSILLVSLVAKHTHIAQEVIMGNLEFVESGELYQALTLFAFLAVLLLLYYHPIRAASFDKSFFSLSFKRAWLFEPALLVMTSLIITLSFRMIGLVAILGFLTVPVLIANLFVKSFKKLLLFCGALSMISSLVCFVVCQIIYEWFAIALASNALSVIVMSLMYLFLRRKSKRLVAS